MRTLVSIGAVVLGIVGVLLCGALIGLGWWTTGRTVDRIDRVTARLDQGLAEADGRLARVEARVNTVRAELNEVRKGAEKIAADNPELPRLQAEIEQLFGKLVPALDRVEALTESLRSVADGMRTAADIVEQFNDQLEATTRVRNAADTIDRAAEALTGLRARVDAVKSAAAVRLIGELITLAREAVAGSERLSEGLAAARQEIANVRTRAAEWRDKLVFWVRLTAGANTLVWLWGGLGQLCLIGWGRRRIGR